MNPPEPTPRDLTAALGPEPRPRRVEVRETVLRWYDVDEEGLRSYYDGDVPDELADDILQRIYEGDSLPDWLKERLGEADFGVEVEVYDVCMKHNQIKERTFGEGPGARECGGCWLERRQEGAGARV